MASMFNQLARERRSVFPDQFDISKKVDDGIINEIIANAGAAPNHGRTEPWHFTVFTREGLETFARFQSELYKEDSGDDFKAAKYQKLVEQPLKASHIISIGMKRTLTKNIPEIEDIEAVACAVQNIYLSVCAYGLGGYWTTGGVTYLEKAKSFFGLEERDKLLGFFYIAHVAIPSAGRNKKPLEEIVNWVSK